VGGAGGGGHAAKSKGGWAAGAGPLLDCSGPPYPTREERKQELSSLQFTAAGAQPVRWMAWPPTKARRRALDRILGSMSLRPARCGQGALGLVRLHVDVRMLARDA
jgi:hypothetical protein